MGIPSSPEIHRKRKTLKNVNNSGGSSTGIVELPEGKVEITMSQRKFQVSPEALQAFQVYQRYDDWASETEKTDYTYSNLSQYKDREVIPGFRLRPNLSRRPIKPSSPLSVYDYTSEGRLEPLFYSTPLSNRSRVSRNVSERESYYEEEAEEVDARVYQETWLNKFTQFFSIILTTLMSSVSRSYGAIAYTLSSVAFFLSSVSRRALSALSFSKTQGGYASNNSLVQGQNGVRSWVTRTTDYIWKYTLTIVKTITTIYHEGAIVARRSNKKKYFWLLLIPLLLLIGWWCFADEAKYAEMHSEAISSSNSLLYRSQSAAVGFFKAITSFVTSSFLQVYSYINWICLQLFGLAKSGLSYVFDLSYLLVSGSYRGLSSWTSTLFNFTSAWFQTGNNVSGDTQSVLQSLNSLPSLVFTNFYNGAKHVISYLYIFITDSAILVGNLVLNSVYCVIESFRTCACYLSTSFMLCLSVLAGLFQSIGDSVAGLFHSMSTNETTYAAVPLENMEEGDVPKIVHRTDSSVSGEIVGTAGLSEEVTANLLAMNKKIDVLESQFKEELRNMRTKEEGLKKGLAEYHQTLLGHRASLDAASRRCCRLPCSSAPSEKYLSSLVAKFGDDKVEEVVQGILQRSKEEMNSLKAELVVASDARVNTPAISGSLEEEQVRRIAMEAIKLYDADKTGKADYALESGGGHVVSIRCTKLYTSKGFSVLGWSPFWSSYSAPEDAIRPGMAPGECWAFQGSVGFLALELSHSITVTGFTMEHLPASLSPMGKMDSAPKHFSMWGLKSPDDLSEQYHFGDYVYEDNGEVLQYFPVQNPIERAFKYVELKIISNHGHPDYTCLYRIRVHGMVT